MGERGGREGWEREREATERERENSNTSSKTLILKDCNAEGQGGEKEGGRGWRRGGERIQK